MLRRNPKKPKTKQELARIGEEHAARYLRAKGYRVIERNFRAPRAEVDIIAEHRGVLVFVEVKALSSTAFMEPHQKVTPWKQRQIARAAARYLSAREKRERLTRFDVVEVLLTPAGRVQQVRLIQGAFQAT